MPRIQVPFGLSFSEEAGDFVLRNKSAAGKVTTIRFTPGDMFGLKETIDRWSDRMMTQSQTGSAAAQPIVVHGVAQVRILPDALQENVLLTARGPSGAEETLSLLPVIAEYIVAEMPTVLLQMRGTPQTRQ